MTLPLSTVPVSASSDRASLSFSLTASLVFPVMVLRMRRPEESYPRSSWTFQRWTRYSLVPPSASLTVYVVQYLYGLAAPVARLFGIPTSRQDSCVPSYYMAGAVL